MAITFVDVSSYLVFSYGGPNGNQGADASISLEIPNGFVFLRFFPEGGQIPPNSRTLHVNGKPIFYANYRYAQFGNLVDLLRNEKPIKFFYRDETLVSYITTGDEPVGEGEH